MPSPATPSSNPVPARATPLVGALLSEPVSGPVHTYAGFAERAEAIERWRHGVPTEKHGLDAPMLQDHAPFSPHPNKPLVQHNGFEFKPKFSVADAVQAVVDALAREKQIELERLKKLKKKESEKDATAQKADPLPQTPSAHKEEADNSPKTEPLPHISPIQPVWRQDNHDSPWNLRISDNPPTVNPRHLLLVPASSTAPRIIPPLKSAACSIPPIVIPAPGTTRRQLPAQRRQPRVQRASKEQCPVQPAPHKPALIAHLEDGGLLSREPLRTPPAFPSPQPTSALFTELRSGTKRKARSPSAAPPRPQKKVRAAGPLQLLDSNQLLVFALTSPPVVDASSECVVVSSSANKCKAGSLPAPPRRPLRNARGTGPIQPIDSNQPPASTSTSPPVMAAPSQGPAVSSNGTKRKARGPPAAPPLRKKARTSGPRQPVESNEPSSSAPPVVSPPIVCGLSGCSVVLGNNIELLLHQQQHAQWHLPFRCPGCPMVFAERPDLDAHVAVCAGERARLAQRKLMSFWTQIGS